LFSSKTDVDSLKQKLNCTAEHVEILLKSFSWATGGGVGAFLATGDQNFNRCRILCPDAPETLKKYGRATGASVTTVVSGILFWRTEGGGGGGISREHIKTF